MVDRGGVERDGVTVLSWQRLPSQLVQQHADRMQMKRPHYHPVKPSETVRVPWYLLAHARHVTIGYTAIGSQGRTMTREVARTTAPIQ